jgi:Tol biopolymer transport system component
MVRVFPSRRSIALSVVLLTTACGAQQTYFGQNLVRYDDFEFRILQTEHFDIYYYPEERAAVEQAGRMAERWYARLTRLLNHELRGRQPIIYYASHPHFQQTLTLGRAPGEGVGGATEVFKRRIVLPFAGPLVETDHVLGHELVHAFQFDMTQGEGALTQRNIPRALGLPLWFIEGMAEYLSVGSADPHTAMWIRDAVVNDRLPTMRQLNDPRFFPYRFGQAFWAYVAGRFGDPVVGRILNAAARGGSAEAAIEAVLRIPIDSLNAEWHQEVRTAYAGVREVTEDVDRYGRSVLTRDNSGILNSSPALSPNGDRIVFISERDRTSIDLFLAPTDSGTAAVKLVEMATDPHLASLQFIYSAGSWAADGRRFVFAGITQSDPLIAVVDVESGTRTFERTFRELGEILNPTWAPDGNAVAFTALVGGFTDLYVYDMDADSLHRLTNDPYAELHPSWSPDGSQIAFVTDRFSTDLDRLRYGEFRLGLIDPGTGVVSAAPGFGTGKQLNPQWGPDSREIFFLSDRNGITNVYRVDLTTGELYQVTNLYGGVTGITALSPALSTAFSERQVAFSYYQKGGYNIVVMDDAKLLDGIPVPR